MSSKLFALAAWRNAYPFHGQPEELKKRKGEKGFQISEGRERELPWSLAHFNSST
jgi:hypothetical protein